MTIDLVNLTYVIYYVQNVHQGYIVETLERFLKAREWNVSKAHKMVLFINLILKNLIFFVFM